MCVGGGCWVHWLIALISWGEDLLGEMEFDILLGTTCLSNLIHNCAGPRTRVLPAVHAVNTFLHCLCPRWKSRLEIWDQASQIWRGGAAGRIK